MIVVRALAHRSLWQRIRFLFSGRIYIECLVALPSAIEPLGIDVNVRVLGMREPDPVLNSAAGPPN